MNTKTMNLKTAANMDKRIKELQRLIEEKTPELSQRKGELELAENRIRYIQSELDKENATPVRGEVRLGRMSRQEKQQKENDLRELEEPRAAAEKNVMPLQHELDEMTAELNELLMNPPKADIQDLIIAKRELDTLDGQIQQIEAAAERSSKSPTEDHISDLKTKIDLLSAERDMTAADVDLGKATPADLKKISTEMGKLKKKLEDLEETSNLSESTQRGYQRHLDTLRAQHTEAERGYRVMITLYARAIYADGLDRLRNAAGNMEAAIADITTASNLASLQGDGESLGGSTIGLTIDANGIHDFDKLRLETDGEEVSIRIEKIMQGIQEQAA